MGEAAERFALLALGRGRRSRPARKRLRVEKGLKCSQNPQRQVHALLVCPTFGRLAAQKTEHRFN
jgi:hypothetical protein